MKSPLKSYLTFTRTERMGLIGLCGLLLVLVGVRVTMVYWVHPAENEAVDSALVKEWDAIKEKNSKKKHKEEVLKDTSNIQPLPPLPKIIDLNTADSATLVRLPGISKKIAHKIIAHRQQKLFKNIIELSLMYPISETNFDSLKKRLVILKPNK